MTDESFMECATCRSRPGSPTLCEACLHNRALIGRLEDALAMRGRNFAFTASGLTLRRDRLKAMEEASARGDVVAISKLLTDELVEAQRALGAVKGDRDNLLTGSANLSADLKKAEGLVKMQEENLIFERKVATENYDRIKAQLQKLQRERDEHDSCLTNKNAELETVRDERDKAFARIRDLSSDVQRLTKKNAENAKDLGDLRFKLADAESRVAGWRREFEKKNPENARDLADLRIERDMLKVEHDRLVHALKQITESNDIEGYVLGAGEARGVASAALADRGAQILTEEPCPAISARQAVFRLRFVSHATFCEDCVSYMAPKERRDFLARMRPPFDKLAWQCQVGIALAQAAEGLK